MGVFVFVACSTATLEIIEHSHHINGCLIISCVVVVVFFTVLHLLHLLLCFIAYCSEKLNYMPVSLACQQASRSPHAYVKALVTLENLSGSKPVIRGGKRRLH